MRGAAARALSGRPRLRLRQQRHGEARRSRGGTRAASVALARLVLDEAKAWKPTLFIGPWPAEESKQPVNPTGKTASEFRNARIAEYSAAYATLARELAIPYLDLFAALGNDSRWRGPSRAGDGIHPPAEGYVLVAEKVAAWPAWRKWLD